MASETKILEAIFGPSIPTDQAAILPEIMAHIRAIDGLLQGKPRQYHPRISNPAISGPINRRIGELYAEHGKDWPKIATTICQEFNVRISPDACRGRHKDALARQEAYAAMSGSTSPGAKELPTELPTKLPATFGQFIPHEAPVDPIVDPKPGQQVAQRPNDHQLEAIKAEAIKLHRAGKDVKAIAEKLGVRWQWVRSVIAKAIPHNEGSIIRETPRIVTTEPPKQQEPEKKVPLNAMDARILEMADQGAMVHEICIAIQRNFNKNYSTSEMAEKIRKLQGAEL